MINYNNEFEVIDDEVKAYTLGFIYADGMVAKESNTVNIVQHPKEMELITKIQSYFPFFNLKDTTTGCKELIRCNKKLHEDLYSHGALPVKSKENRENLDFPSIEPALVHHFIRGFFDGDGSVYVQKINNIKVEIGSVNWRFIVTMLRYLYDRDIDFFMNHRHTGEGLRTQDFYRIYTSSYTQSKKFSDLIYKDATIYMKRKHALLSRDLIPRNKKQRLPCGMCQGMNTTFLGFRNKKTRIRCKDCKKMSSVTAPGIGDFIGGLG